MAPKVPLDVEMLHHVFGARKDIFKGIEQAAGVFPYLNFKSLC